MQTTLQLECRTYLEQGPPEHMSNYVPESMTEIIIAHGAKGLPLDPELEEIASIVLLESEHVSQVEDEEIREYLTRGTELVQRVIESNQT